MMAGFIYILCILTSLVCAGLLLRTYRQTRAKLLLWSGLCFFCIAVSNIILFIDMIILPDVDLSALRHGVTMLGMALLLYGLIWETK